MAALTATLRAVLTEKLEPDFPLVSQTGPGVMRMSLAITNVKLSKRKKRLINYTPVGLVIGGLRRLTDAFANLSLEGAHVEAEFTDTQSGERIAVRVATNPFAQSNIGEDELSWDALEAAFGFYASEIRKTLDAAHAGK